MWGGGVVFDKDARHGPWANAASGKGREEEEGKEGTKPNSHTSPPSVPLCPTRLCETHTSTSLVGHALVGKAKHPSAPWKNMVASVTLRRKGGSKKHPGRPFTHSSLVGIHRGRSCLKFAHARAHEPGPPAPLGGDFPAHKGCVDAGDAHPFPAAKWPPPPWTPNHGARERGGGARARPKTSPALLSPGFCPPPLSLTTHRSTPLPLPTRTTGRGATPGCLRFRWACDRANPTRHHLVYWSLPAR